MKYKQVFDYVWQDRLDVALEYGNVNIKSYFTDVEYGDWNGDIVKTVRIFKDARVWVYLHDDNGNKPSSPAQMIDANKVYDEDVLDSLLTTITECHYRIKREMAKPQRII